MMQSCETNKTFDMARVIITFKDSVQLFITGVCDAEFEGGFVILEPEDDFDNEYVDNRDIFNARNTKENNSACPTFRDVSSLEIYTD